MADVPSSARDLEFVLSVPGGGKTVTTLALRGLGYNVLDVDEARVDALEPLLKAARHSDLWDFHNPVWHSLVGGAIAALTRTRKARLLVFDHSGWVIKSLNLWPRVKRVVLVRTPLEVAARRMAKRDSLPYDKAYGIVSQCSKAQESFLRYLTPKTALQVISSDDLFKDPVWALSLTPVEKRATNLLDVGDQRERSRSGNDGEVNLG